MKCIWINRFIEYGSEVLPDGSIHETVDVDILQVIHPIWDKISQPFNAQDIALDEASAYVSYGIGYAGFIGGGLLQIDIQSGTSTTVFEARCNTEGSRATPPNTAVGDRS
ncbi:MAG: hypothetical protein JXA30_01120 [Deltaproteobacteria bacterium]|nr:hypothetical protein [Deltaproteobacteria bacterium]